MSDQNIFSLQMRIAQLEAENQKLRNNQVSIAQAKELYVKILDDFPALIWRAGTDKLCNYFNRTWLEFTGKTLEQEFGYGWANGVHPDDLAPCVDTYNQCFDNQEPFCMEYRLKNRHNEYRWIRDFGRPFYDLDHTFLGYIGSCYDITENVENEKSLKELNGTKDKFFSLIAHDLRNPLGAILGISERLYQNHAHYSPERLAQITQVLFIASQNTFSLLENLLIWARKQFSGIQIKIETINFEPFFRETIENFSLLLSDKNIQLETHIAPHLHIHADNQMLQTILRNLISNAVKFSHTNSKITLTAIEINREILIVVEDQGIGIPPERLETLFGNLPQQSISGTSGETGSGLGLMLCKEFVALHHGKIWAESTLGKGSRFKLTIPLLKNYVPQTSENE